MREPVITVKGLSKVYRIDHEQKASAGNATLVDVLSGIVRKPIELIAGHKLDHEKFWALKDINIDIHAGDVVGLIGRNGSGKSTFLKTLSRITEPTEGEIVMRGKTASLLEVGTGFHPELTGRENIFFNGAILGMKQSEIRDKFDAIVEFSGVEKFLDTPVKFYSSGMYVRLAFAVAAHLEPDILIVDEVLAVGDAEFQKKSLGKMRDVAADKSRTVIFVSHSMEAIQAICNKVVWLSSGEVKMIGETDKVIAEYMSSDFGIDATPIKDRTDRRGNGKVRLEDIVIQEDISERKAVDIDLTIHNKTDITWDEFKLSLDIYDSRGMSVSNMMNSAIGKKLVLKPGITKIKVKLTNIDLVPGQFVVNVFLASDQYNSEIFDWVEGAGAINVPVYDYYDQGTPPDFNGRILYMDYEIEA